MTYNRSTIYDAVLTSQQIKEEVKNNCEIAPFRFAAQISALNSVPADKKTTCRACGAPMLKGGRYYASCSAICFRDAHC